MINVLSRVKTLRLVAVVVLACVVSMTFSQTNMAFADSGNKVYKFDDWIYYDPINGGTTCNETNYWTLYNQNTSCYRWFLIENDSADNSTLKLILDHSIATTAFDGIEEALNGVRTTWLDYGGNVRVITQSEIDIAMALTANGVSYPTLDNISVKAGAVNYRLATNSLYYINGVKTNTGGFWSSTLYNADNSYAYTITEFGNNRLVKATETRGVRPVITVGKAKLAVGSGVTNVSDLLSQDAVYKYTYDRTQYDGHTYKQLQGFTVTNSNIVFYSSNAGNPEKGLVFGYGGNNYGTAVANTPSYVEGWHGNDMAFNSKTNEVVMAGPAENHEFWLLDGDTLQYKGKVDIYEKIGFGSGTIGYDEDHDYYMVSRGRTAHIMNSDFEILYTFDMPHDETAQGIEYHDGYLYQVSWMSWSCPSTYQVFCSDFEYGSTIVNVYNMKFNADGTPSKNFGRRVQRLWFNNGNDYGEAESIAFQGGEVYLGYAAQHYDSEYVYKFYHFPYSAIEIEDEVEDETEDEEEAERDEDEKNDEAEALTPDTGSVTGSDERGGMIIVMYPAVLAVVIFGAYVVFTRCKHVGFNR